MELLFRFLSKGNDLNAKLSRFWIWLQTFLACRVFKIFVLATVLCHFLGFRPGKRHASSAMSEAARVGLGKENLVTEF